MNTSYPLPYKVIGTKTRDEFVSRRVIEHKKGAKTEVHDARFRFRCSRLNNALVLIVRLVFRFRFFIFWSF